MPVVEILVTLGGLAVIGFLAWFFFGPKQAQTAQRKDNIQEINITEGNYYLGLNPLHYLHHPVGNLTSSGFLKIAVHVT